MGQFDFDRIIDRRGTFCSKWDYLPYTGAPQDNIPMWIADMDFAPAPAILESISAGIKDSVLGYFRLSDEYYESIFNWHKTRHGRDDLTKDMIDYHNGVVGGLAACVAAFTDPGDMVLIQSPGYPQFRSLIEELGRVALVDPLDNADGYYTYNFDRMEKLLSENKVKMTIMCNPHNPSGRVWSKEELSRYIDLCYNSGTKIVVDEIWCELELKRAELPYISAFSANDKMKEIGYGMYSASKGFNLAGMVASYSICYNPEMQEAVRAVFKPAQYNTPNLLSERAVIGAYSKEGEKWLDECLGYIDSNMALLQKYLAENMPKVNFRRPDATYVAWLDFSAYDLTQEQIIDRVVYKAGIILNDGSKFIGTGEGFMRMNLATPRAHLERALPRLKAAFEDLK